MLAKQSSIHYMAIEGHMTLANQEHVQSFTIFYFPFYEYC